MARQTQVASRRQRLTLFATCLTVLIVQLDTTIVNLALHAIQTSLGASVSALQWVVDAYNVVYASLILGGGTLGDRFGRRRWWAIGVAIFCGGCSVCALAPSTPALVGGRVIAGVGAALALPGSLAVLSAAHPDPRQRARAVSVWAGINGIAIALGPVLGGVLVDAFGWRSIFSLVLPVGALALLLAPSLDESADPAARRMDIPGQLLTILALGLLAAAAIQGQSLGWLAPLNVACATGAAVSCGALYYVERRSSSPLLPLDVFGRRAFSGAIGVAASMTFGMYGMLFLIPLYLQSVLGLPGATAGLVLMPLGVVFATVSPLAGRAAAEYGPRPLIAGGMGLAALSLALLSAAQPGGSAVQIVPALCMVGLALGLTTGPLMAVAMSSAPPERTGMASGLVNVGRMLGATLGVAILGSVFAVASHGAETPAEFVTGARTALLAGAAIEFAGCLIALVTMHADALFSQRPEVKRRYA